MKIFLSLLIAGLATYASATNAEQVLTCDVRINTLESQHSPIFGFTGERVWTGAVLKIENHNVVKISGLGRLSGFYIPEAVTDDGIQFGREGIPEYPNIVVRGTIKRHSGKLYITEVETMFGARFDVQGLCSQAKRLF